MPLPVAHLQPALCRGVFIGLFVLLKGGKECCDAVDGRRLPLLRRVIRWFDPSQRWSRCEECQKIGREFVRHPSVNKSWCPRVLGALDNPMFARMAAMVDAGAIRRQCRDYVVCALAEIIPGREMSCALPNHLALPGVLPVGLVSFGNLSTKDGNFPAAKHHRLNRHTGRRLTRSRSNSPK